MTSKGDLLFVKYDLRAVLEGHERTMLQKIDAIDQKELRGFASGWRRRGDGCHRPWGMTLLRTPPCSADGRHVGFATWRSPFFGVQG